MTAAFVKRNSSNFFDGKQAKALKDITNLGGDVIPAGTVVSITGKSTGFHSFLDIKADNGVIIYLVDCESLELVKDVKDIEVNNPETIE